MKRFACFILTAILLLSLAACGGKSDAATALDEKILSLGEISIESKQLVEEIEAEYAKLTDKEKNSIENMHILEDARATLDELQAEYEELQEEQEEHEKVQKFAEKLSTIFADKFSEPENVKINNCWYAKDKNTGEYYFTYYISTMNGNDYQYWGNDSTGFSDLSNKALDEALSTVHKNGHYNYSNIIKKSGKTALKMDGIELDAEAIQDYYMRNS